jgi:hypothetical protein
MQISSAKHERDLQVSLDERHKIEMLIVDTKDSFRRAERLEQACTHAITRW